MGHDQVNRDSSARIQHISTQISCFTMKTETLEKWIHTWDAATENFKTWSPNVYEEILLQGYPDRFWQLHEQFWEQEKGVWLTDKKYSEMREKAEFGWCNQTPRDSLLLLTKRREEKWNKYMFDEYVNWSRFAIRARRELHVREERKRDELKRIMKQQREAKARQNARMQVKQIKMKNEQRQRAQAIADRDHDRIMSAILQCFPMISDGDMVAANFRRMRRACCASRHLVSRQRR